MQHIKNKKRYFNLTNYEEVVLKYPRELLNVKLVLNVGI